MPLMVLNRDYTLASTMGHIITFKKGDPINVPVTVAREAAQIGAEVIEGDAPNLIDEAAPVVQEPEGDERKIAFFEAFKTIKERNQRGDFTGAGLPAARAMNELMGFKVDPKETVMLWREYEGS